MNKNTTQVNGVVVEGGWRHSTNSDRKTLGFTIIDPISGANIAEVELDEKQVLNLLSSTHTGHVGGQFNLRHSGLARIGKIHALIDVHVSISNFGTPALGEINAKLERAWELAGGFPWEPTIVRTWNGHHSTRDVYNETMHGYFDASMTEESINERFIGFPDGMFSNLRVFAERHQR